MEQPVNPDIDKSFVDFDSPEDPYMPQNWPMRKKIRITHLYSLCTMCTTWASTIYNSGLRQVQAQFHISQEVALLGMSLYLLGFVDSLLMRISSS